MPPKELKKTFFKNLLSTLIYALKIIIIKQKTQNKISKARPIIPVSVKNCKYELDKIPYVFFYVHLERILIQISYIILIIHYFISNLTLSNLHPE